MLSTMIGLSDHRRVMLYPHKPGPEALIVVLSLADMNTTVPVGGRLVWWCATSVPMSRDAAAKVAALRGFLLGGQGGIDGNKGKVGDVSGEIDNVPFGAVLSIDADAIAWFQT